MPMGTATEPKILDQIFGCAIAQMNQNITAPLATQTSLTVQGSAGSGGIDVAIPANSYIVIGTPGTGATLNNYTHVDVIQVTSLANAGATSLVIASQTISKNRAVGDYIFLLGSTTSQNPILFPNTLYLGLSTQSFSGATDANLKSNEASGGGYARIPVLNNNANFPDASGSAPASSSLATAFSFPTSSGAWSSSATLNTGFVADSSTLGGGNIIWYGQLNPTVTVSAASTTVTFGVGSITLSLL